MKKFWLVLSTIGILFMSIVVPVSANEFNGIEKESDIPEWYQKNVIEKGQDYVIFELDGVVYASHVGRFGNGTRRIRIIGDVPERRLRLSTIYEWSGDNWEHVWPEEKLPKEIGGFISSGESGYQIYIDELIPFGRFKVMYSSNDIMHDNEVVFQQAPVINTAVQRKLATETAVKEMGADFGTDSLTVLKSSLLIFGAILVVSLVPRTIRYFVG